MLHRHDHTLETAGTFPPALPGIEGAGTSLRLVASTPASFYVRWGKPLIDRLGALVLLLVFLPLLVVTALALLVTLGRPIFFRQQRVGRGGEVFEVYKFRTMHHSRRRAQRPFDGPERRRTHKHPHDPRLVPLGRALRRWSVDELPQLVNVLKGEMSLVGPRPELVGIVAHYEPWQHERHDVKPGLTGLWQVKERSNSDSLMHEHTHLDIEYVRRVSFLFDLKLLVLTVPAALGIARGF
jgi:lipopolysaccharide/colanic/teichoic acid biosynthesis glycosyltransferase